MLAVTIPSKNKSEWFVANSFACLGEAKIEKGVMDNNLRRNSS